MNNIVLPSGWLWVITLFAPLLSSVIVKKAWDDRIKQAVAMLLSVVLAILIMWVDGSLMTLPFGNMSIVLGSVFAVSELAYRQIWSPLILTTPVEKKATVELKEVLYVDKAVPVIEAGKALDPVGEPVI